MSYIISLKDKLLNFGLYDEVSSIAGCDGQEIRKVQVQQKVTQLPSVYHDFLIYLGRGAGFLFRGSDYTYEHLSHLKDNAISSLAGCEVNLSLVPSSFVFFSHQGYIFYYFDIEENSDDPTIYGYKECEAQFKKVADSFTQLLDQELKTWTKYRR